MSNKLLFSVLFALSLTAVRGEGGEIFWDTYGVPHIYARDKMHMYYAFGWAQMHNHADLILRLYGQARGRAAEYWGEKYLPSDKQVLLFQLPALAKKEYAEQSPEFKPLLKAFVDGMNAYARAHPEMITTDLRQVLPLNAEDVIAHELRVVFLHFVAGTELGMASRRSKAGSNAYAIGPSRSATKNAMLMANPHLPWGDLFTFFEAQLQSPGFNAYGVSVVGLPVLNIAFNDHLGWTLTVNPIDACDRYELSVKGESYWLDSTLIPFEKKTATILVRQADGRLEKENVSFLYSRHGPVADLREDKAYAVRIAGLGNANILYQWHRMGEATGWAEFEAALKMMQLPMFNVIYADDKGNISYLFDGNVPVRSEGDWKFWSGAVDGTHSRYIWRQVLAYEALPKLFNPASGFIQNANDPPWTCTYPPILEPGKYRGYIAPQMMSLRPQRAVNMIRKVPLVTFENLIGLKLNTGMEAADRFLNDLLAAVDKFPDTMALKAAVVLKKWDRSTNADSRGAILFARWYDKIKKDMFVQPWDPARPVETPAGLKDPEEAVSLLTQAAGDIIKDYDSLDVAWGDVYRFRLGQQDLPANGGPEQYGIYRTIYFSKDSDKRYRAVAGDSYVAVIEFGKKVRARVLLSYGNASQPGSRHAGDQLPLLSRKELRPALLSREEVLKSLEEKEMLEIKN